MECPNCKANTIKGYLCMSCGVDIAVFYKSTHVSNLLYNQGLEKAKKTELTAAIDILSQSIEFNKNNYVARNLLGLVYYEVGQIGDALKQWILSTNMVKQNNQAMVYMKNIQNNPDDLYSKNDAIVHYNKGLVWMNKKEPKQTIEELKKAIEINPKFLLALNLLTFAYLIDGNKDEALTLISRVLNHDKSNKVASRYHTVITGKPYRAAIDMPRAKPAPMVLAPPPISVESQEKKYSFITVAHAASFVIGALIAVASLFFFIMPGLIGDRDSEIAALSTERDQLMTTIKQEREENQNIIENLSAENQRLEVELSQINSEFSAITQANNIEEARTLLLAGNPIDAAEILYNLDTSLIYPEDVEEILELGRQAFSSAAYELYTIGLTNYNLGNFEIAVGFFLGSLRFAEINPVNAFFLDDAIYFLGRIHQIQGDYDAARGMFLIVIEEHPGSNVATQANQRLNEVDLAIALAMAQENQLQEDGEE